MASITDGETFKERFTISRATPNDAEEIVMCQKSIREESYLLNMIYPKDRAHLTTPEEFHAYRVRSMQKLIGAKDLLYFKVTTPVNNDPERIIAYAAWWMPGHFSFGKTILQTVTSTGPESAPKDENEKAKETTGDERPLEPPKDDSPACIDVELRKKVASKVDERRRAIWGDNVSFWYDQIPPLTSQKDLGAVGVSPEFRRRGIATRLVKEGLDRADREGVPAYLEASPSGALMYPGLGFHKVGEEVFFEGKYIMEFHLRPAQTTS